MHSFRLMPFSKKQLKCLEMLSDFKTPQVFEKFAFYFYNECVFAVV